MSVGYPISIIRMQFSKGNFNSRWAEFDCKVNSALKIDFILFLVTLSLLLAMDLSRVERRLHTVSRHVATQANANEEETQGIMHLHDLDLWSIHI